MSIDVRKSTLERPAPGQRGCAPRPEPRPATCELDVIPERVRQIAMLRGLGYSYRQIAEPLGVSPQAVSLMLTRHRRSAKSVRGAMELSNLSSRAVNVLGRHGIRTREQARRADLLALLAGERNCGRKTADEIARWMHEEERGAAHPDGGGAKRAGSLHC